MEFECRECDKKFSTQESLNQHNAAKHSSQANKDAQKEIKHKTEDAPKEKKPIRIKKKYIYLAVIVVIVAGVAYAAYSAANQPGKYDSFAQCITEKGAVFYGTFWCPHCTSQKAMFGTSMKYVNYIECSTPDGRGQTKPCQDANIRSYPTWEFADGSRLTGAIPLAQLAQKTNCTL